MDTLRGLTSLWKATEMEKSSRAPCFQLGFVKNGSVSFGWRTRKEVPGADAYCSEGSHPTPWWAGWKHSVRVRCAMAWLNRKTCQPREPGDKEAATENQSS